VFVKPNTHRLLELPVVVVVIVSRRLALRLGLLRLLLQALIRSKFK
jgi:hypothetical protein